MNSKSVIFAVVSIRPHPLRDLVKRLPYAERTAYKQVKNLEDEGLIVNHDGIIEVAQGFRAQKLREIYILSLSYGIDPEILTRDSTLSVWKEITQDTMFDKLRHKTNFSHVTVGRALMFLKNAGLIEYTKGKPIIARKVNTHPLNKKLQEFLSESEKKEVVFYSGRSPFQELLKTPEQIEKILYEQINKGLAVRNTGFLVKGKEGLVTIIESVDKDLTLEEYFIRKLMTTEGVEDICARIISQEKLDYLKLLDSAKKRDMVNIVGLYLDLVNEIKEMVPHAVLRGFQKNKSKRRKTFLKQEKQYGKGGWEDPYEKKWNVNIYLDLGAIRHGVRSL